MLNLFSRILLGLELIFGFLVYASQFAGPPGQAPGAPPGYGPHPGDPNAAYYYGHQMDPTSMQARPHGWPPQGYPPGAGVGGAPPGYPPAMRSAAPMRTAMPQQMMQVVEFSPIFIFLHSFSRTHTTSSISSERTYIPVGFHVLTSLKGKKGPVCKKNLPFFSHF